MKKRSTKYMKLWMSNWSFDHFSRNFKETDRNIDPHPAFDVLFILLNVIDAPFWWPSQDERLERWAKMNLKIYWDLSNVYLEGVFQNAFQIDISNLNLNMAFQIGISKLLCIQLNIGILNWRVNMSCRIGISQLLSNLAFKRGASKWHFQLAFQICIFRMVSHWQFTMAFQIGIGIPN